MQWPLLTHAITMKWLCYWDHLVSWISPANKIHREALLQHCSLCNSSHVHTEPPDLTLNWLYLCILEQSVDKTCKELIENYSRLTYKDTCTKNGYITLKNFSSCTIYESKRSIKLYQRQINQLGRPWVLFQPGSHSFTCCVNPPSFPRKVNMGRGIPLKIPEYRISNVVTSLQLVTSYYLGSTKASSRDSQYLKLKA